MPGRVGRRTLAPTLMVAYSHCRTRRAASSNAQPVPARMALSTSECSQCAPLCVGGGAAFRRVKPPCAGQSWRREHVHGVSLRSPLPGVAGSVVGVGIRQRLERRRRICSERTGAQVHPHSADVACLRFAPSPARRTRSGAGPRCLRTAPSRSRRRALRWSDAAPPPALAVALLRGMRRRQVRLYARAGQRRGPSNGATRDVARRPRRLRDAAASVAGQSAAARRFPRPRQCPACGEREVSRLAVVRRTSTEVAIVEYRTHGS